MENKNHNLEDFLRSKLNEFDASNDGWDQPDASVWEGAQTQIPPYTGNNLGSRKAFKYAALGILLLLLATYIIYLQNKNSELHQALRTETKALTERIEKLEVDLEAKELTVSNLNAKNQALAQHNQTIIQEKENLISQNQNQQRQLRVSKKAINKLNNKLQERGHNFEEKDQMNTEASKMLMAKNWDESTLKVPAVSLPFPKTKNLSIPTTDIAILSNPSITPFPRLKTKLKKFEVGLEYGWINLKVPTNKDFEDWKEVSEISKKEVLKADAKGLHFAFSPNENLFIKTGFRKASFHLLQKFETGLFYDEEKEYEKPDGSFANDFNLNFNTPLTTQRSTISMEVPADANLKTDDVLIFYIVEQQKIDALQIPLGIQYHFGKNKLRWFLEGGGQWNKLTFRDYSLETYIEDSKSKQFEVDKIENLSKPSFSKQHLSLYGGLGFNYQWNRHWFARGAYLFNYHFIKNESKEYLNSEITGRTINLGIGFRF